MSKRVIKNGASGPKRNARHARRVLAKEGGVPSKEHPKSGKVALKKARPSVDRTSLGLKKDARARDRSDESSGSHPAAGLPARREFTADGAKRSALLADPSRAAIDDGNDGGHFVQVKAVSRANAVPATLTEGERPEEVERSKLREALQQAGIASLEWASRLEAISFELDRSRALAEQLAARADEAEAKASLNAHALGIERQTMGSALEKTRAELAAQVARAATLSVELSQANLNASNLAARVSKAEADSGQATEASESERRELTSSLENARLEIQAYATRVQILTTELSQTQALLDTIPRLQFALSEANDVAALERSTSVALKEALDASRKQADNLEKDIDALIVANSNSAECITDLESRLANTDLELLSRQAETQELQVRLSHSRQKVAQLEDEIVSLQDRLTSSQSQYADALENLTADLQNLKENSSNEETLRRGEIEELNDRLSQMDKYCDDAKRKIIELEDKFASELKAHVDSAAIVQAEREAALKESQQRGEEIQQVYRNLEVANGRAEKAQDLLTSETMFRREDERRHNELVGDLNLRLRDRRMRESALLLELEAGRLLASDLTQKIVAVESRVTAYETELVRRTSELESLRAQSVDTSSLLEASRIGQRSETERADRAEIKCIKEAEKHFEELAVAHKARLDLEQILREHRSRLAQQMLEIENQRVCVEASDRRASNAEQLHSTAADSLAETRQLLDIANQRIKNFNESRVFKLRAFSLNLRRRWSGLYRRVINRQYNNILFDSEYYLSKYPDVLESPLDPYTHYLKFGAREGRDPNPFFCTTFYLANNPDVAEAGVNPLIHYLEHGAAELRDPHPSFSTRFYVDRTPELNLSKDNPLAHYLERFRRKRPDMR